MLITHDGILEIMRVKPDGKKSMDASAFFAGLGKAKNEVFEWGKA